MSNGKRLQGVECKLRAVVKRVAVKTSRKGKDYLTFFAVAPTGDKGGTQGVWVYYFGRDLKRVSRGLAPGSEVGVVGRVEAEAYTKDGEAKAQLKVFASHVKLLECAEPPADEGDEETPSARPAWDDSGRPMTPARRRAMRENAPSAAAAAIPGGSGD